MAKVRTQDIVRARNIIHNILYEKYNMNLTDIGRYFGQGSYHSFTFNRNEKDKRRFWDAGQSIWQEFQDLKETIF